MDSISRGPTYFREREVGWCSVGENVGVEINGKGDQFTRPILILRKLDSYSFIGLPLTTAKRIGSWYTDLKIKNKESTIILSQARHFDYRRMSDRMCTVSEDDFKRIRARFIGLITGTNMPPASD